MQVIKIVCINPFIRLSHEVAFTDTQASIKTVILPIKYEHLFYPRQLNQLYDETLGKRSPRVSILDYFHAIYSVHTIGSS